MTSQPPGCPPGMRVAFLTKVQEIIEVQKEPVYYARLEPVPPGERTDEEELEVGRRESIDIGACECGG